MPRTEHTTLLFRMLHWLPISSRIAYKIDSIYQTSLTNAYPKNLSKLLTVYTPARPLRSSSDPNILNVATTRTKSYSQGTFAYQKPSNWNRIPGEVWSIKHTFAFNRESWRHSSSISRTKISKLLFYFYIFVNLYVLSVYCCVAFQL